MTVSMGLRAGWCLLASLALTGCGGLFHSDARPEQVYFLRATPMAQDKDGPSPLGASLRFIRPMAAPGLDSSQIVLVQSDRRMSFYLASRWAAPGPTLIETLAVEKLRGSRIWQSIGDSSSGFPSDYVIQVTVRRFEADYTGGNPAPEVHVVLDCIVGRRQDREVVGTFLAEGTTPAAANKLSAVVAAFEVATNTALDSMTSQTAEAVRTAMAQKSDSPVDSRNR